MTLSPDRRLLRAVAAWTVSAFLVVVFPWLWAPLAGALAVLAALVVCDLLLLRRARRPVCERYLPERAFIGHASEVTLVVRNDDSRATELDVIDEAPADLTAAEPTFAAVTVEGNSQVVLRYPICPTERGDRSFGPAILLIRSPLGLLRRRTIWRTEASLRVYPDTSRFLRPEALDARRVFAAIGVRAVPQRGEGTDFESLRDFVFGDDPRRIDWAATARRARPVTRVYQHERNHTVIVAVDASRLMASRIDNRTKLDYAADAALALAYAALVSGDRVGMVVFDDAVRGHLAPRAQRQNFAVCIDFLRTVQPRPVEANYRELLRSLTVRQPSRALVVLLTDFIEADAEALAQPLALLAQRHRVLLVAIRDRIYHLLDPAAAPSIDSIDVFRRVVVDDLLRERDIALLALRRQGVQTLDLVPEAITVSVLNRYLATRYGSVW